MKRKYFMIAVMAAALGMTACSSQKTETEAATATTAAVFGSRDNHGRGFFRGRGGRDGELLRYCKDSRGYGYYSNRRCRNRSRI